MSGVRIGAELYVCLWRRRGAVAMGRRMHDTCHYWRESVSSIHPAEGCEGRKHHDLASSFERVWGVGMAVPGMSSACES